MKFLCHFSLLLFVFSISPLIIAEEVQEVSIPLTDEKQIIDRDLETGFYNDIYKYEQDKGRVSFVYHVNINPLKSSEISGFELNWGSKTGDYWFSGFFSRISGQFSSFTRNPQASTSNSSAESNNAKPDTSDESLTLFGAGGEYRFNFLPKIPQLPNTFETVSVYITYGSFNEQFTSQTFNGVGLRTDYGIHIRSSKFFHWGARFSYNILPVKRDQLTDNEPSIDRSLLLSYMTIGLEASLHY